MSASEVRQNFASAINKVAEGDTRIIIKKDGAPVAAIVPIRDVRTLEQDDKHFAAAWELVEEIRERFKDVPPEEIEREAEKAVREAREELRAERERLRAGAAR